MLLVYKRHYSIEKGNFNNVVLHTCNTFKMLQEIYFKKIYMVKVADPNQSAQSKVQALRKTLDPTFPIMQ